MLGRENDVFVNVSRRYDLTAAHLQTTEQGVGVAF